MLKTVSTYLSRVSRAAPKYLFAKKKKGDGEKDEYEEQLKSQEDFETPEAEIAAGTVKEIEGDGADTPVTGTFLNIQLIHCITSGPHNSTTSICRHNCARK